MPLSFAIVFNEDVRSAPESGKSEGAPSYKAVLNEVSRSDGRRETFTAYVWQSAYFRRVLFLIIFLPHRLQGNLKSKTLPFNHSIDRKESSLRKKAVLFFLSSAGETHRRRQS